MRRSPWTTAALVVLAAALLPFLGTLGNGFAYDDETVLGNPLVTGHRFGAILVSPYHAGPDVRTATGIWRPLTSFTFAADHALAGASPAPWHATNLLLHAACCLALLAAARALAIPPLPAAAATVVFAVHPLHAEVVASVANRSEAIAGALVLGALAFWRRERAWASGACFALALLSKETAVAFVAVAATSELALRRFSKRAWGIAGGVLLAYLASRLAVLGSLARDAGNVTVLENPAAGLDLPHRVATALPFLAKGIGLLVWPHPLLPDYGFAVTRPATRLVTLGSLAGAIVLAGLAAAWGLAAWKRRPAAVALALLLAPWLLVANLVVPIGTIFGERLLYLPSAGAALLLGAAFARADRRIVLGVATPVALLLGAVAFDAASAWKDDFTLFRRAAEASPESVRAQANLGAAYASRGELPPAEDHLRRALALAPETIPARLNLAGVLLARGDRDGAAEQARRVLESDPGNPIALHWLEAATPPAPPGASDPREEAPPLPPGGGRRAPPPR